MGEWRLFVDDQGEIIFRVVVNQNQSLIWLFQHQLVLSVIIPPEDDARPTLHVFLKWKACKTTIWTPWDGLILDINSSLAKTVEFMKVEDHGDKVHTREYNFKISLRKQQIIYDNNLAMDGTVKLLDFLLLVISQMLHQIKLLKILLLSFWVIWNERTLSDVVVGHSMDIVIRMPPSALEIHSMLNGENIKTGTNDVKLPYQAVGTAFMRSICITFYNKVSYWSF